MVSKTAKKFFFKGANTSLQEPFSVLHSDFVSYKKSSLLAALQPVWTSRKKGTTVLPVMNRMSWKRRH